MSSIKNLTYRLWRRVEGGNIGDDSRYTYEELAGYIRQGVAIALKGSYYEVINSSEYKYNDANLTVSTKQTVTTDSDTGLKYVDIPLKSITISGSRALSITSVNPVSTTAVRYIPIREEEVMVAKLQTPIPNVVLYYRMDDRAYFYNKAVTETEVKVNQKYTLPTDDDAEITVPEAEATILENALRLMGQLPTIGDRDNNGVPI